MTGPLTALAERWRQTATELRDYGETTRAGVLERCAGELDGLMDEHLKPSEAAAEQGFYSEGAIRKMLSDGPPTMFLSESVPCVSRFREKYSPFPIRSTHIKRHTG